MQKKYLSEDRPVQTVAKNTQAALLFSLVAVVILGCSDASNQAFKKSHDSIHPGMTLGEAFNAGLADYMISMGTKNVAAQRCRKSGLSAATAPGTCSISLLLAASGYGSIAA